jgi:hypothetical protein
LTYDQGVEGLDDLDRFVDLGGGDTEDQLHLAIGGVRGVFEIAAELVAGEMALEGLGEFVGGGIAVF